MANIKIAQLTNKTTLADTDIIIVESATATEKMTVAKLKELLGINSGGIVESGTNANGSYTKFADGTLICRKRITGILVPANIGAEITWTFPKSFLDGDSVDVSPAIVFESSISFNTNVKANTSNTSRINLRHSFTEPLTLAVGLIAVGRWKA